MGSFITTAVSIFITLGLISFIVYWTVKRAMLDTILEGTKVFKSFLQDHLKVLKKQAEKAKKGEGMTPIPDEEASIGEQLKEAVEKLKKSGQLEEIATEAIESDKAIKNVATRIFSAQTGQQVTPGSIPDEDIRPIISALELNLRELKKEAKKRNITLKPIANEDSE